jgi:preprotein translocase subunit SecF
MEWIKPGTQFDFISRRKLFIGISAAVILLGVISVAVQGGLRLGIDFTGGSEVHLRFTQDVNANEIRQAANELQLGEAVVQQIGLAEDNEYLVRVPAIEVVDGESVAQRIENRLAERLGAESFTVLREELVGPRAGSELRQQGILAVLLSFIGILLYVGIRFDFKFAVGAIVALFHDTLIVLAVFSFFDKELTLTVIAAILTIIGFSINDTVIIYDRIRENMRLLRTKSFAEIVNISLNETLARTVLTSFTLMAVAVVLYFLGGSVLNDFAFTMIIGVIVGVYSSIYIAAPIVIGWHQRKRIKVKVRPPAAKGKTAKA